MVRQLFVAGAVVAALSGYSMAPALAATPVCTVYEDGSAVCTYGDGSSEHFNAKPGTSTICYISKAKVSANARYARTPEGTTLVILRTRGTNGYVCVVTSS